MLVAWARRGATIRILWLNLFLAVIAGSTSTALGYYSMPDLRFIVTSIGTRKYCSQWEYGATDGLNSYCEGHQRSGWNRGSGGLKRPGSGES